RVGAPEISVDPGAYPGTGRATPRSALGLPLLALQYHGIEMTDVVVPGVIVLEGTLGDDAVRVTPTSVVFTDLFGRTNVTEVAGAAVVALSLMDGNDEVTIDAAAPLPFDLEIRAGGGDIAGDALRYAASIGPVALDLEDQLLVEAGGSAVRFDGIERFAVDMLGRPLTVSTSDDDDTVRLTPMDRDGGRLVVGDAATSVRYDGLDGLPISVNLAGGEDHLVVDGSSTADAVTVDATGMTFTDDGRRLAYTFVEALTLNGLQGDDRLDVDNSNGLVTLPGGLHFDGGAGHDVLRMTGTTTVDESVYDVGPGAGAGSIAHRIGTAVQTVTFSGLSPVIDTVPGPLVVNATGASNAIDVDAGPGSGTDAVQGAASGRVAVDSYETLEFARKSSLTLNAGAGDDLVTIDTAGLPDDLESLAVQGASSTNADTLLIRGGADVDEFAYAAGSGQDGTVSVETGTHDLNVAMSGFESLRIDGAAETDRLLIDAAQVQVVPDDHAASGTAMVRDAGGQLRLTIDYIDTETVRLGDVPTIAVAGGAGDDIVQVTPTQVLFTDAFGNVNATDVSAAQVVVLDLMDGNDVVTIDGETPLPFHLDVQAGAGDHTGDLLRFTATTGDATLDVGAGTIVEANGSSIDFAGFERFEVDAAGHALSIRSSDDDDTARVAPLDLDQGRLVIEDSGLSIRFAGLDGGPVAIDLAGGQDALVVEGSTTADTITLDAQGVRFADGRSLTYASAESVRIDGRDGDDRLDVDNAAGLVALPGGARLDGGPGRDLLRLHGPIGVDASAYEAAPGTGRITHTAGDVLQIVEFTGIENAVDIVAGPLVVTATGASNVISVDEGPHSSSDLVGAARTAQVSIDGLDVFEFTGKTSLTIFALAGHDTIDLNDAPRPTGLAEVILDGGSGDDMLTGGAGDDLLIGGRGEDVLVGASGDDTLSGGDGDDMLQGRGGDDRIDGGAGTNLADGGTGFDTVILAGTADADSAEIGPDRSRVNGDTVYQVGIEHIALDTGAGDDDVTVRAVTSVGDDQRVHEIVTASGLLIVEPWDEVLAERVDVDLGAGDDAIEVDYANRAPLSIVSVDGGAHVSGDTTTIQGMTGDDQFDTIRPERVAFGAATTLLASTEDLHVIEGTRIDRQRDTIAANRHRFTDRDGNETTVRMSGPGAVDIFRDIADDRAADIQSIELHDTSDRKTRLTVDVKRLKGTDDETSIGSIAGSGGARSITARRSDLVRGGSIRLGEGLGSLRLDDIDDHVDLILGGDSGRHLTLRADVVGNGVQLTTGSQVRRADVTSWAAGGALEACAFGTIRAREGFAADIVNTQRNRTGYGVGTLDVRGPLATTMQVDRVRRIMVRDGDLTIDLDVITDHLALGRGPAVTLLSVVGGDLRASNIRMQPDTMLKQLVVKARRGQGGKLMGPVAITGDVGKTSIDEQVGPVLLNGAPVVL
ncbi:MAG: hypothetical protein CMJ18_14990, partial [Phycisphaeraceae bacterium]|nr:hypothetical protein [Phycisphaeraceae bacterium]